MTIKMKKLNNRYSIAKNGKHIRDNLTGKKLKPYLKGKYYYITIAINEISCSTIKMATLQWMAHYGSIPKGYLIHHEDLNSKNDNIRNLRCCTTEEHNKINHLGNQYWLGKKHRSESLEKMRNSHLGKRHSAETRKNLIKSANRGQSNPSAKILDRDIDKILYLVLVAKKRIQEVADKFGVHYVQILRICNGTSRTQGSTQEERYARAEKYAFVSK